MKLQSILTEQELAALTVGAVSQSAVNLLLNPEQHLKPRAQELPSLEGELARIYGPGDWRIRPLLDGLPWRKPAAGVRSYRTKPAVIEAVQWTGDETAIEMWTAREITPVVITPAPEGYPAALCATIVVGSRSDRVEPGDYIVRHSSGTYERVLAADFAAEYEPA